MWATVWWKLRAYAEFLVLTRDWSWSWGQAACRALGTEIVEGGFDLMIPDVPPNPSVVPFVRLARGSGIPIVMDFRDMWDARGEKTPWWGWISPSRRA